MSETWKKYYEDGAERIRKMRDVATHEVRKEEYLNKDHFQEARSRVLSMVEGFNFATRDLILDIAMSDDSVSGEDFRLLQEKLRLASLQARMEINEIRYEDCKGIGYSDKVHNYEEN